VKGSIAPHTSLEWRGIATDLAVINILSGFVSRMTDALILKTQAFITLVSGCYRLIFCKFHFYSSSKVKPCSENAFLR
jgi:hypothetical protein